MTTTPVDMEALGEVDRSSSCGIIMPIAAMGDYDAAHWAALLEVVSRAIAKANLSPVPVWTGADFDIIHDRIVRNLYDLPIAVCVTSGLNPNVMLELGMRLAFGKPTIIVTDGVQRPPFDIGVIEYVAYDRALQIIDAEAFIERLATKIVDVRERVETDRYRPFIKTFGQIVPGELGGEAVSLSQEVIRQVSALSAAVARIDKKMRTPSPITLGRAIDWNQAFTALDTHEYILTIDSDRAGALLTEVTKELNVNPFITPLGNGEVSVSIPANSADEPKLINKLAAIAQKFAIDLPVRRQVTFAA